MSITNCIGDLKYLRQNSNIPLKDQASQIINSPRLAQNLLTTVENNVKLKKSLDSIGVNSTQLVQLIQQTIHSCLISLEVSRGDNLDSLYNQIRKSVNTATKNYLVNFTQNDNIIGKIQGFLGDEIKNSIKKTAVELGTTRGRISTPEIGDRVIQTEKSLAYLSPNERAIYLSHTRNLDSRLVYNHVESTDKLQLKNLDPKLKKFTKEIEKEIKKSILRVLISFKNLSPSELNEYSKVVIEIWTNIYSNPKINLWYLRNTDIINQKIIEALSQNRLSINVITCPDYSGFYDESGVFHFDFKGLGSGQGGQITSGVVTAKSFDLVEAVVNATSRHVKTDIEPI